MSKNIYHKILSVQSKVMGGLRKDEENKFLRYKYVSELDILILLKPILKEEGLLIIFSDDSSFNIEEKLSTIENKIEWSIKYLKKISLINVDNPEEIINLNIWACAKNFDPAKAKGSAETYCLKYFLMKFFLLPTYDNLDPDIARI